MYCCSSTDNSFLWLVFYFGNAPSRSCWAVCVCCCLFTVQAPCYDIGAIPTSAGLQAVGNTSPARGRPLLTFLLCPCRVCVFTGNFMRAVHACVQPVYLLVCWAWSDFPTGGGAPGLSLCVAASLTTHHVLHVQSEALTACTTCTSKRQRQHSISSFCFTLPKHHTSMHITLLILCHASFER